MVLSRSLVAILACAVLITACGCGFFEDSDSEPVDDFPDLGAELEKASDIQTTVGDGLGEPLRVGDRFPFTKTIEQTLTQYLPSGPQISRSEVVLSIEVAVRELRDDGSKLFELRYHDVSYQHEIGGERVVYRHGAPGLPVPPAAQTYDRLVDNGFQFWLGPDNQVLDVQGFDAFLNRCISGVPPAQQGQMQKTLTELHGRDGLVNFVDAGIGLMPTQQDLGVPASAVEVGATWTRQWQVPAPLPLLVNSQCKLKSIDIEQATIEIEGMIQPAGDVGGYRFGGTDIAARGGRTLGSCIIDRATGLPVQSRVDCMLVMGVRLPDGNQFEQHKRITTTIASSADTAADAVSADYTGTAHADHHHSGGDAAGHNHGREQHTHGGQEIIQTGGFSPHPRD